MNESLQQIYDRLGTVKLVAAHLGRSTNTICSYLRGQGVSVRTSGSNRKRWPKGKIEPHRIANSINGDPAFRAAPVHRHFCQEQSRPCVLGPTDCPACRSEHSLDSYSGNGASSSWFDPSQGSRGRQVHAFGAGR